MPRSPLPPLPAEVTIREVGPRDGLQVERPIPPDERAALTLALLRAGIKRIEAASFVSPKAVPPMAGAAEVVAMVLAATRQAVVTALVPNARGATDALEAGVDELTVTVAASAAYNEKNVRRTIEESVEEIRRIAEQASPIPVDAVVSCAFGSPYEGPIPAGEVAELVERLLAAGASAITLADTTGMATPPKIEAVLVALDGRAPGLEPGLHLHETRGTAMLNAYAALQLGISRFDTSVGGLGGSPFADGAGGNLATEDFVAWLEAMGIRTGIDLSRLLAAARLTERLVGHDLASTLREASKR